MGRQVADRREAVEVDLDGRTVTVPKGGLCERYRMDTDLDEVARDPRVSGVDFFRQLPKTRVAKPVDERKWILLRYHDLVLASQ